MKKLRERLKEFDRPEYILLAGFLAIFILPGLIAKTSFWFAFDNSTGVIGDTIGGITAPISGLVGAYLVWKALREQITANDLIRKQFTEQKINDNYTKLLQIVLDQIKMVREDVDSFIYTRKGYDHYQQIKTPREFRGADAISKLLSDYPIGNHVPCDVAGSYDIKLIKIELCVGTVLFLLNLCKRADIYPHDRYTIYSIIFETYDSRLSFRVAGFSEKRQGLQQVCSACHKRHGASEIMFTEIDAIEKFRTYLLWTPGGKLDDLTNTSNG